MTETWLLEEIRRARQHRTPIPSTGTSLDLEAAYRIQQALCEGRVLRGFKLGLLSEAKQRQMGIQEPIYGRICADMLLERTVSLHRFVQPRLEPELATILRQDLPPGSPPGVARKAMAGWFLGLDILDSIWQDYRFTAAEVVADNASGGGFVLGEVLLGEDLPETLRLYVNGALRTEGRVEALGDPALRLCWLADRVGGLRAGQVVFLGSPAAAVPAERGVVEVAGDGKLLLVTLEGESGSGKGGV
ncbi:MAG: fumarylacetoacetate hydrolase family protein [Armatimonadota bacterium]|nr:fumarylacetoacetate hydrolase family protein [Armatimonadota bacterium]MDR7439496.1 fumarylacetoacetate hydrolase family protein [Armatimonadota bacterium]MDR7563127.1 fumarylacetoacetate hydrolase family protein [Armatimonadota bacterium]MDR7568410.1 fumarylacetoacetate hydrolase family protein [Armatimonadota bacterium]MDR7600956.1 fumarylacetoacetate hydrolase family protein [Armatimonadota bacterium]